MPRAPQSLVRRLALSFLLPSLVALAAGASIAYHRTTATLRDSIFDRLGAIATLKEAALDTWVDQLYLDLVFSSKLPSLNRLAADLVDEEAASDRRRLAHAEVLELLQLVEELAPSLTEVFFLAPSDGRVLASTEPANEGALRLYDRYYVEGRQGPFIQNVYPSPVTLRPTLTVSAPVRNEADGVIGVLATHVSVEYLDQGILGRTGLGQTGAISLVDKHKVLVTGRRYGNEGLSAAATSMAIEEVIEGRSDTRLYRNPEGTEVIGVYRWLEDRELGLIVEIDQQEAFAPARRMVMGILLVGSLFLVPLIFGIYIAARRIASPILAITDAAVGVREGDLEVRATARTDDEIGDLARTFNSMVEQLASDTEGRRAADAVREALISELEDKNAELERFTYTVSHDLKSPLLTIRGFAGALRQDLERGDALRVESDIQRIEAASSKMSKLLGDLLELSRIGRVANPMEEVSLDKLAREVVASTRESGLGAGVDFEIAADLGVVLGDEVRVREVLQNLVENACRFKGNQTAPKVIVGWRLEGDERVHYVRDNGTGIAPEYHEKVFDLFDRLDESVEGTGIGLAIVRRVIDVHGGRVWIESDGNGRGSTFCFTLPSPS